MGNVIFKLISPPIENSNEVWEVIFPETEKPDRIQIKNIFLFRVNKNTYIDRLRLADLWITQHIHVIFL